MIYLAGFSADFSSRVRGMSCYDDQGHQICISTFTSGQFAGGYCVNSNGGESFTNFQDITVPGPNTITFTYSNNYYSFESDVATGTLYAPLLQINWQATDKPVPLTSTPTSSLSSPITANSKSISPQPTTLTPNPSSTLSTGAKVAIGVTIPVALLAITGALGLWLLYRRRRGRTTTSNSVPVTTTVKMQSSPHAPTNVELNGMSAQHELETPRPELGGGKGYQPLPQEMGT